MIIALVMSLGIGGYLMAAKSNQAQFAIMDVQNFLTMARSLSLRGHMTTKVTVDRPLVEVDPLTREVRRDATRPITLRLEYMEPRAQWHFEDEEGGGCRGAFGIFVKPKNCVIGAEAGKYGRGVSFVGYKAGEEGQYLEVEERPFLNAPKGFLIRLWVNPAPFGGQRYLFARAGQYMLQIDSDGYLVGGAGGAEMNTRMTNFRIPSDRWSLVEMGWAPGDRNDPESRGKAMIRVNNIVRAQGLTAPALRSAKGESPLYISFPENSFVGVLDEFTFFTLEEIEKDLPKRIDVTIPLVARPEGDPRDTEAAAPMDKVVFDPMGRLDQRRSGGGAVFKVANLDLPGQVMWLFVNPMGVTRPIKDMQDGMVWSGGKGPDG